MFDQRVTGLKLELAGDFANPDHHVAAESSARPEDRVDNRRYLQPWFDRAFRQDKVHLQRVGNIILHNFECAFRLRFGERHAELIEAPFWEMLRGNFSFRVGEKSVFPLLVQVFTGRVGTGFVP